MRGNLGGRQKDLWRYDSCGRFVRAFLYGVSFRVFLLLCIFVRGNGVTYDGFMFLFDVTVGSSVLLLRLHVFVQRCYWVFFCSHNGCTIYGTAFFSSVYSYLVGLVSLVHVRYDNDNVNWFFEVL